MNGEFDTVVFGDPVYADPAAVDPVSNELVSYVSSDFPNAVSGALPDFVPETPSQGTFDSQSLWTTFRQATTPLVSR